MIRRCGYQADILFQQGKHAFKLKGVIGAVTIYGTDNIRLCLVNSCEYCRGYTTVAQVAYRFVIRLVPEQFLYGVPGTVTASIVYQEKA